MNDAEQPIRERCYRCRRPKSLCFCNEIPQIDNRTDVLILQHVVERSHAFNTVRIVHNALQRCELVVDHTQGFAARELPIGAGAGLLFPAEHSVALPELPIAARPQQLVIIDGTWHQAKTIVRDVTQLHGLPCYRLNPTSPGQYRIRLEPDAHTLSTLEATVAALKILEPNTANLEQMLAAFNRMVDDQLAQLEGNSVWRKKANRKRTARFIPQAMLNPGRVIVAYGESTPGIGGKAAHNPAPVSWSAQRLGTTDRFECLLKQNSPVPEEALRYMRLSPGDFDSAISQSEFRERWKSFLRPHDTLVVYHPRTYRLLRNVQADQPHCLVLKSVFGNWRDRFRSMEELAAMEGLEVPENFSACRTSYRLQLATALVEHLIRSNSES